MSDDLTNACVSERRQGTQHPQLRASEPSHTGGPRDVEAGMARSAGRQGRMGPANLCGCEGVMRRGGEPTRFSCTVSRFATRHPAAPPQAAGVRRGPRFLALRYFSSLYSTLTSPHSRISLTLL